MFKLIGNIDQAYVEASNFMAESMPDSELSKNAMARAFPHGFPSLIDWFVNQDYRGRKVLDSHICDKVIAKCLVYPKTNKLRYANWYIMRGSVERIPDIVKRSVLFNKDTKIIKTDGFEIAAAEVEQGESFLLNSRTLFTKKGQSNEAHISTVSISLARKLVYYKKDMEKYRFNVQKNMQKKKFILYNGVEVNL